MTLVTMRQIARLQALSNGSDTSLYTPFNMDIAIQSAVDEFIDGTAFTKTEDVITLTANTAAIPALPTNCVAGRILSAYMTSANVQAWAYPFGSWISYTTIGAPVWDPVSGPWGLNAELQVVDIATYYNAIRAFAAVQQPGWLVFSTQTAGFVYPTPNENYTLAIRWYAPMTIFEAGTQGAWVSGQAYYVGDIVSNGGTKWQCVVPNASGAPAAGNWVSLGAGTATEPTSITAPTTLPDNVLREILVLGAPAFFMFNKPEMLANARKQFEDLKSKYNQLGSLAVKSFVRTPARYGGM